MKERTPFTPEQIENHRVADLEMRDVYPYTKMAHDVIDNSETLKKSRLLNNTISQKQAVDAHALLIRNDEYHQHQVAMWLLIIHPDVLQGAASAQLVCNFYGTYIDALRASVCLDVVGNMFDKLPANKVKGYVYLRPILTAFSKDVARPA